MSSSYLSVSMVTDKHNKKLNNLPQGLDPEFMLKNKCKYSYRKKFKEDKWIHLTWTWNRVIPNGASLKCPKWQPSAHALLQKGHLDLNNKNINAQIFEQCLLRKRIKRWNLTNTDPENNNASTSQIDGLDSSTKHKSNWNFCSCKLIKKIKNRLLKVPFYL